MSGVQIDERRPNGSVQKKRKCLEYIKVHQRRQLSAEGPIQCEKPLIVDLMFRILSQEWKPLRNLKKKTREFFLQFL